MVQLMTSFLALGPMTVSGSSEKCWFCLGSSSADLDLVISVGDECYIALDKGGISGTHALVVPIDHACCSVELKPQAFAEVER